jgi:single-strand DNA-binding protein
MFYEDMNTVVVTGNLTRDIEKRTSPGGTVVANIRIGVNGRRKEGDTWVDKPNFFTVTTFGKSAENALQYLKKGRRILVQGRLDWSEYDKDGEKRQGVQIIAARIMYLPSKASLEEQAAGNGQTSMVSEAETPSAATADGPSETTVAPHEAGGQPASEAEQPVGVGAGAGEEEIPF